MQNLRSNRLLLAISSILLAILVLFALLRDSSKDITLNEASKLLDGGSIKSIIATDEYVYLKAEKEIYKIASSQVSPQMFVDYKVKVKSGYGVVEYMLAFLILLAFISLGYRFYDKSQKSTTLKARQSHDEPLSHSITTTKSDVSFDDIGGIEEVKSEIEEIIDFLKRPKKYKNFGARLPKGVLLVGSPGVGKTMIAKAMANEAGVNFYYQSGASFVQIYVGMGAKRVAELFRVAKNSAPSIIFIDEIDAVGKSRDGSRNDEREATLNQLLTEMDGFESSSGVMVVAATNKIEVLDSALLRSGRFDRRIFVDLPTKKERSIIVQKYLSKVPNSVDADLIANMTTGFNGASLAALVNEATLLAIRQNEMQVTQDHFLQVKDKVMFGKKRLQILTKTQKAHRITYQSAKVVVATYFGMPFEKLLLSSDKLTPSTNEPLLQSEIQNRIMMLLAGLVACDVKYGEHASSVEGDLSEAKELVVSMLTRYGMGEELMQTKEESTEALQRLYDETSKLLDSLDRVVSEVELSFAQKESADREFVAKLIDDLL
ncbi:MAG: ATP-dependent metallopeptidase FtsH/Yme1/Tma family protein [Sulfuricurvum sp.]